MRLRRRHGRRRAGEAREERARPRVGLAAVGRLGVARPLVLGVEVEHDELAEEALVPARDGVALAGAHDAEAAEDADAARGRRQRLGKKQLRNFLLNLPL